MEAGTVTTSVVMSMPACKRVLPIIVFLLEWLGAPRRTEAKVERHACCNTQSKRLCDQNIGIIFFGRYQIKVVVMDP
jgi:hypothetical protein